ncbi:MAG: putative transporter substrate binding protein [Acidimicrobiia bacterium]|nr:putative transporter substrate binding protein [Acidimicrobiia bacterium]
MTANKRRSRVLGPLVVVALILAACGGDSGDTTTTAGEATTTAAEATTTVVAETTTSAAAETTTSAAAGGEAVEITAGDSITATFLPKCTNIAVFPQANSGAEEAAAELGSDPAEFVGPADCGDTTGQIEFMTNAVTQGVDAIMLSNNSGDQLDAPAQAAADAGIPVVTWDSPIPSATGESVFVAQVDFDETGQVMAEMARTILGDDGGEFAILSATPDAANQNAWIAAMEEVLATPEFENLVLVETVYGNDVAEDSVTAALGLVDSHPDLELIMAPTTVGIVAAAQAMTQEGLCETIKVSGLGLPEEMAPYVESGCAPEFALWSFVDLGYLAYYVAYGIATEQIVAEEGATFVAGRMGEYEITADPTRDAGLRVLMGPFSKYNAENPGT